MLRNLVWPAVVSALGCALAVITALVDPSKGTLVLAFGLTSVAMACLSQRA